MLYHFQTLQCLYLGLGKVSRPDYAPSSSDEEDDEALELKTKKTSSVILEVKTEAEKDDRRLKRILERQQLKDVDSDREDDRETRSRLVLFFNSAFLLPFAFSALIRNVVLSNELFYYIKIYTYNRFFPHKINF